MPYATCPVCQKLVDTGFIEHCGKPLPEAETFLVPGVDTEADEGDE